MREAFALQKLLTFSKPKNFVIFQTLVFEILMKCYLLRSLLLNNRAQDSESHLSAYWYNTKLNHISCHKVYYVANNTEKIVTVVSAKGSQAKNDWTNFCSSENIKDSSADGSVLPVSTLSQNKAKPKSYKSFKRLPSKQLKLVDQILCLASAICRQDSNNNEAACQDCTACQCWMIGQSWSVLYNHSIHFCQFIR